MFIAKAPVLMIPIKVFYTTTPMVDNGFPLPYTREKLEAVCSFLATQHGGEV